MGWNPHITVATLVRQENIFLLVAEWEDDDLALNQPAGHRDENGRGGSE